MEDAAAGSVDDPLEARPRTHWLEPIPDVRALPSDGEGDPFQLAALRQSTRLAFVSALQQLPPRQRAALLLTEVVGLSAAEVAQCLGSSIAAVNSAIQRARATLGSRHTETGDAEPLSEAQTTLLERYVDAFHRYDVDGLVALMREDVSLSMPPYTLWLRGPDAIRAWLLGRGSVCRGSRLVPTAACASPAFAQYHLGPDGTFEAWAIIVLELAGDRITAWNAFLDTEKLLPLFGLSPSLGTR
jgi:RNA polymerase sigma-70 factor (ECF subfamily)